MKDRKEYILLTRFRTTSFDSKEEAMQRASALETVGYQVKVFCKEKTLFKDNLILLHQTAHFGERMQLIGGAV